MLMATMPIMQALHFLAPSALARLPAVTSVRTIYYRTYGGKGYRYLRPNPRPYRRRLYDAAVRPEYPEDLAKRKALLDRNRADLFFPMVEHGPNDVNTSRFQYNDYELYKISEAKKWIEEEQLRLLLFCHVNAVGDEPLWLASNQIRMCGFELAQYEWKLMRRIFEGTPASALQSAMTSDHTAILFGRELEDLRNVVKECKRYRWITPLVAIYEHRVLPMELINELMFYPTLEHIYAETVQLLEKPSQQMVQYLEQPAMDLCRQLEVLSSSGRAGKDGK